MAAKKTVKKVVPKKSVEQPAVRREESKAARKPAGPSAKNCPLVLDGEVDAADFSPSDCMTCSEFDCRFCEAEQGSGALRSRLFAASEEGDGEGDDLGSDFAFEDEGSESGAGDGGDEGEEDEFA